MQALPVGCQTSVNEIFASSSIASDHQILLLRYFGSVSNRFSAKCIDL